MTSTIRSRISIALVMVAVAGVSYAAGFAQGKQPVNRAVSTLKWEPAAPGSPIQFAMLWGDRSKPGEYTMLLKMPPGSEAGRHSHTADYHAVAVQGTWVHTNDGNPATPAFPPGSYVMQPGKLIHNDLCKSSTDCIILVHQHAQGDFIAAK